MQNEVEKKRGKEKMDEREMLSALWWWMMTLDEAYEKMWGATDAFRIYKINEIEYIEVKLAASQIEWSPKESRWIGRALMNYLNVDIQVRIRGAQIELWFQWFVAKLLLGFTSLFGGGIILTKWASLCASVCKGKHVFFCTKKYPASNCQLHRIWCYEVKLYSPSPSNFLSTRG